jgi:geranylgeranyl reductase family protein
MATKWDVVVVGAGPAGSTVGYELARRGVRVLILEKETFPRYKACAGGVNIRTAKRLPFAVEPVVEDRITGAWLTFRMGEPFTKQLDQTVTYTVSRERFDQFLLQHAAAAGSVVREGQRARVVRVDGNGTTVFTDGETVSAQIVVGADGANGVVGRSIGLMRDARMGIAIESEVEVAASDLERWRSTVLLDLGSIREGYGWIFPKADHLSIGAAGPVRYAKQVHAYYQAFTGRWRREMRRYRVMMKQGHRLPMRRREAPIQRGPVLLVGDAAGLTDPLDGEGIYYAIRSGQLAAGVIADHLEVPQGMGLARYEVLVDRELMVEIQRARAFMRVFNACPGLFVRALRRNGRLWQAGCELLRGETTYVDIGRVLGPFEFVMDWVGR